MSFDAPRIRVRTPVPPDEEARLRRRAKLLALAGALDDIGLRARIVEYYLRPTLLRCWDPERQGVTKQVSCERTVRWEFRYQPSGELLADAEMVAQPDDAQEAAHMLAVALAARM